MTGPVSETGPDIDQDPQNLENLGPIWTGRSPDLAVHELLVSRTPFRYLYCLSGYKIDLILESPKYE